MAEMVETAWTPEAEALAKAPLPVNLATVQVNYMLAVAAARPTRDSTIPQVVPVAEVLAGATLTAAAEQMAKRTPEAEPEALA